MNYKKLGQILGKIMILEAILQYLHEEEPEKPVSSRRMNGSRL